MLCLISTLAFAEDHINLDCDVTVTEIIKQATTKQIPEEKGNAVVVYPKVNTINTRTFIDNSSDLDDVTISTGVAAD